MKRGKQRKEVTLRSVPGDDEESGRQKGVKEIEGWTGGGTRLTYNGLNEAHLPQPGAMPLSRPRLPAARPLWDPDTRAPRDWIIDLPAWFWHCPFGFYRASMLHTACCNPMAIINLQTFVIRGVQNVPHWLRKDSQSHDNVIYSDKPGIDDMITYGSS
ncbi:uncharacterized protein BO88DRAFT_443276 [Aspergillus vadensis CBS 113365]|uniref:Uncharacterized protein n=1 Tax=Aspergillus vadensis (strain CBS 113365 / IMI 142717 / IBT 24658) TaxID=1448311 RepID=A0A319CNI7_ASPVC|nr:hypothetical protein BO88DRAFT_443276 [Aspergillus vadensis CBS 113365]PYH69912.1 hypothetical protein BO88DRAFT_443276 [Aspergillus vadensis CBS 113365]